MSDMAAPRLEDQLEAAAALYVDMPIAARWTPMKNPFTPLGKRGRARRANERAAELRQAGRKTEAVATYQRAMAIDPTWSEPFFNLGVHYKYERDWRASLDATLRATELDPKHEASWWNLGVAATALGRWDLARQAWRRAGVKLPDGDGPIHFPCGKSPIRLSSSAECQTVWAERLDPARARLSRIPLGGYCYGDVVLNDSAPTGFQSLNGKDVPVFDCLALLEPSPLATWRVDITLEEPKRRPNIPGPLDQLDLIARERGLAAENWTTHVRALSQASSREAGTPHERPHRPAPAERHPAAQRIAIAARTRGEVQDLLADWDAEGRGALVGAIHMEFSHA